jgi:heme/copper-type cytochrome/quinol oxidase subunit 3
MSMALLGVGLIVFGSGIKHALVDGLEGHEVVDWSAVPFSAYVMLGIGVAAVVGSLVAWFVQDHKWWGQHLGTGNQMPKAGGLLFIASEVFLFGALFANFFSFQERAHATHVEWGMLEKASVLKTAVFSVFLFASSATVHKAEAYLKRGDHKAFVRWWGLTIVLGAVFLVGQVLEYSNLIREGHTLGSSQFITAFFLLTGTHGLHVFGGLVMLTVIWIRAAKGQFNAERHAGPEIVAIYWHFVDLVWVFVFGILYLIPLLMH